VDLADLLHERPGTDDRQSPRQSIAVAEMRLRLTTRFHVVEELIREIGEGGTQPIATRPLLGLETLRLEFA
jgi:hypothetical protein